MPAPQPEPWLCNTHREISAVPRAVVHALEQAVEDVRAWCAPLSLEELNSEPHGLPSVAFQLRHIVRSLDRLLTYAERDALTNAQLQALANERAEATSYEALFADFERGMRRAMDRVLAMRGSDLAAERFVGRSRLPVTLGGLLVHIAEHTQRHVGQAITTAKVNLAIRAL